MRRNRLTALSLMFLTAGARIDLVAAASQPLAPGVSFTEVMLPRPKPARLWIYLPSPPPAGKLPCVVIAPSGSALFSGMKLQDGDRAEHLPYVRAGFAVIAYDIDGPIGAK